MHHFIYKVSLYMKLARLHQRAGIWLLLWPCWWSIAMASEKIVPEIYLFAIFAIGAIVTRGAGCVINDIIDRKIDAQVIRTKNRPLATGELSVVNARWFLCVLLSAGLAVLYNLNNISVILSMVFFIPVAIYPYMKRVMSWPQVFLAFTFNAGAIIGWAAATGSVGFSAFAIYAAGIFWTLGYDTIYAHQDKNSDKLIGVKSSAISLMEKTKIYVTVFYMTMIVFLVIAGSIVFTQHNLVFYSGLIIALIHLLWQIRSVNLDDPSDCMSKFRSNGWFGWIIFIAILIEKTLTYI